MKSATTSAEQCILDARAAKKKEQKRVWNESHRDLVRSYGRAFYQRNKEQRKAYSREYNRMHSEERKIYSKEYYQRKKMEDPNHVKKLNARSQAYRETHREERNRKRRENYRKSHISVVNQANNYKINEVKFNTPKKDCANRNKIGVYKKTISDYAYRSIESIKNQFPEAVERYLKLYPFEQYGHKVIANTLSRNRIFPSHGEYADCFEAGMIAYLYSVHRCASMNCDYTVPYIRKMVRIYIVCALVIYNDAKNLCRINGFREIRLDTDSAGRRY